MYLKRLTVCGFKSFADKIDFEFHSGITCVVGPNGCGKSNVVDAIKWVLGEQSSKSLRGRQMLDMIFNGSSTRKSSGMAQVDLVFDNADGKLATEEQEVTVSRKLYRSGESEYLLNGKPVRLKDIRELFMDTGVGLDAYSVIEQGKVDSLLQANPQERRAIFEEAAGISRYNARKKEAERKMARVKDNLDRAQDIVDEVERRLRSVKLQAGKARNFQSYDARMRELRSAYSLAEYHRFTLEHQAQSRIAEEKSAAAGQMRERIGALEAEAAQLSAFGADLDSRIQETDGALQTASNQITSNEERIAGARQRMIEHQRVLTGSRERREAEVARLQGLGTEIASNSQELEGLSGKAEEHHQQIAKLLSQDRELASELTHLQARIDDEKTGIVDLLRRTAKLHNEIAGLEAHHKGLTHQKNRLGDRHSEIMQALEGLLSRKMETEGKAREIEELLAAETARLEEKRAEARRQSETHAQITEELASAKERRSGLLSRKQVLEDLTARLEGIGAGVRQFLEKLAESAEDQDLFDASPRSNRCVKGLVGDLFEADVAFAGIIEAALGELDQYLVVTDSNRFVEDVRSMGELAGRVNAVCIDRLPPYINIDAPAGQPGFVAKALDLVRYPEDCALLAKYLLGRTMVVETIEDAVAIAGNCRGGFRFVSREGHVLETDGRMAMGPAKSRAGLISRRSELRDIGQQLDEVEQRINLLSDRQQRSSAEIQHLDAVQQELRTAIYEVNTTRVENNAQLARIVEDIRRLTEEQPLVIGEVQSIEAQLAEAKRRTESNQANIEQLDEQNRQREEAVAKYQARVDELVATRRQLAEQVTEQRIAAGQITEKRSALIQTLNNLRSREAECKRAISAAENEVETCSRRIEEAEDLILTCSAKLDELYLEQSRCEAESARLRDSRAMIRQEIEQAAGEVKTVRATLEEVETQLHQAQIRCQEEAVRRQELVQRVADELSIDLAEQYAAYEHAEQDWTAVEQEIADLRQKINRLGNVNLDAIGEQEELEGRFDSLTQQRDDLLESSRQLFALIERLNKESRDRFRATFEQIRDNFRELFRKLFNGGRADIILEDSEDVLEAGIEIIARPPGKEPQSISLLSGGEKTMTAIALLMSVLKSRPSPFAILDEVDAALDEANNIRFNHIVEEFLALSQFIVITHSKRTMSIADTMYGVTMEEPGVSRRVSVRFDDQSVKQAVAVA